MLTTEESNTLGGHAQAGTRVEGDPNLLDYDALCCSFSWDATRTPLERATGVSASERDYLTGQMAAART